jgi:hypothetical protein
MTNEYQGLYQPSLLLECIADAARMSVTLHGYAVQGAYCSLQDTILTLTSTWPPTEATELAQRQATTGNSGAVRCGMVRTVFGCAVQYGTVSTMFRGGQNVQAWITLELLTCITSTLARPCTGAGLRCRALWPCPSVPLQ